MSTTTIPVAPIRRLLCTCCGESFYGRQFHNQDTGFGMGPCCAERVLNHRPFGHEPMTLAEFERTYGLRGFNFDVVPKLVITMEGGLISSIVADGPVDVATIDYDTDGVDAAELTPIPQGDGKTAEACASIYGWPQISPERTAELWEAIANPAFRCKGCGREESVCSADPCAGVIADRGEEEEPPEEPGLCECGRQANECATADGESEHNDRGGYPREAPEAAAGYIDSLPTAGVSSVDEVDLFAPDVAGKRILKAAAEYLLEKQEPDAADCVAVAILDRRRESRFFDESRRKQGFRSQAHLDAFYVYFDHTQSCAECQKPGPGVLLDDGYQPTMNRCAVAQELDRKQWEIAEPSHA